MISIIITSFNEPETIGKAIESITSQKIPDNYELLVACPDKETTDVVKKCMKKNSKVKHIKDPEKGKPAALNMTFKKAKGEILILTDGDVYVSETAISEMLKPFKDKTVGAVTGRPISLSPRGTMLGFWSHLLTDVGAHETRTMLSKKERFIVCSGYLMAIRKGLVKSIPENSLSDDAIISNLIYAKGYKITYTPEAKVFVKYPITFKDWIKQKRRSAGGYVQIKKLIKMEDNMRTFGKESKGILRVLKYPKTLKEFYWTSVLIFARLYLWSLIYYDNKIKNKKFTPGWARIESTK